MREISKTSDDRVASPHSFVLDRSADSRLRIRLLRHAADRSDPRLAERYDWLSPAILRFLRRVNAEAKAAGVPVRVCGEMAGRPLEAMALIGIGIDSFSITPAAVGPVKAMVRSIDARAVRDRSGVFRRWASS